MTTIIDATGSTLGRLSTNVAKRILEGEEIAVVNSEKAIISGRKTAIKEKYKKKRQVGTYRKGPYFPKKSDQIVKRTIRGMIPYQKPHGREAFKKVKCYNNIPDMFKDKKMEKIKTADKKPIDFITLEELSRYLGVEM